VQPSEHYRILRGRITELVLGLSEGQLATVVPGCPEWSVRDLVSHLSALAADVAQGRNDGAGSDAWTARQIMERAGRPVDVLLAEWAEHGPQVDAMIDDMGLEGYRIFYDAAMHEDDLREALGLALADGSTHAEVLGGLAAVTGPRLAGLPPLQVRAGERSWSFCGTPPVAVLNAPDEGELGRVLAGRRSAEQLRALDWTGDAEPYLDALSQFRPGA